MKFAFKALVDSVICGGGYMTRLNSLGLQDMFFFTKLIKQKPTLNSLPDLQAFFQITALDSQRGA